MKRKIIQIDEAIAYLKENGVKMDPEDLSVPVSSTEVFASLNAARSAVQPSGCGGGCPGSLPIEFQINEDQVNRIDQQGAEVKEAFSELRQWPVQLHLLNPQASYFRNADVVLAADCVAFSMGSFHSRFLKGKSLAIACPKLDSNKESYVQKLATMIAGSNIHSLTVLMMEVPCCGGLLAMAEMARKQAGRNVPVKRVIISIKGEVLEEEGI